MSSPSSSRTKDPYDYKAMVSEKYLDKTKSELAFEVIPHPEPGRYDMRLPSLAKGK